MTREPRPTQSFQRLVLFATLRSRLIEIMPDKNAASTPTRVDASNPDSPFKNNRPMDAANEAGMLIKKDNLKASSP